MTGEVAGPPVWQVVVGVLALLSFPLGLCVLGVIDELVMPVVRRRVRAWRRRRRARGPRVSW